MKKKICFTEIAYIFGVVFIALGTMLMEKSDFGVSMIVAPAYLIYRWLNPIWSFVTFGMAEYCLQAVLLVLMSLILRRFRISYLLSFVTAVIYGFVLDGFMLIGAFLPSGLWPRIVWFLLGVLFCSAGVSMMFHTYLSPEAYELFVKEVSAHFGVNIHKFKTGYDCVSCLIGIVISFLVFGFGTFVGVRWGTVACTPVNGFIISRFTKFYESRWEFKDALPWRAFFTDQKIAKS